MAGCGSCCEQTCAAFEVGLSLDQGQGVYSGWSDVVVSSQLRLCHTCIIDVMKEFQSIKAQKEKQKINFKTNRNLRYDKKFTMRDLKRSLKKSNNSSPGPDQIHYEILRHLPIETLHIILDIINETWKSDKFPESWREALIRSVPKPGKDHFNPLNYRPIALTIAYAKQLEGL